MPIFIIALFLILFSQSAISFECHSINDNRYKYLDEYLTGDVKFSGGKKLTKEESLAFRNRVSNHLKNRCLDTPSFSGSQYEYKFDEIIEGKKGENLYRVFCVQGAQGSSDIWFYENEKGINPVNFDGKQIEIFNTHFDLEYCAIWSWATTCTGETNWHYVFKIEKDAAIRASSLYSNQCKFWEEEEEYKLIVLDQKFKNYWDEWWDDYSRYRNPNSSLLELKDLEDEVICDKAVVGDEDVADFVGEAISRNLHACIHNPDNLPISNYSHAKVSEKKKCARIEDVATGAGYSVSFQGSNSYFLSSGADGSRSFYVLSLFENEPEGCLYTMTAILGETEKDISKFLNDINSASSYGNISKIGSNRIVFENSVIIPYSTKEKLLVNIQLFAAQVRLTFMKLEEYLGKIHT